jgi:hypothetical protein
VARNGRGLGLLEATLWIPTFAPLRRGFLFCRRDAAGAPVIDAATPRAAVGNGATPRAAHTKNKTDREAYNGCCPCGHRDSPVCLRVYIDETLRGSYRRHCFGSRRQGGDHHDPRRLHNRRRLSHGRPGCQPQPSGRKSQIAPHFRQPSARSPICPGSSPRALLKAIGGRGAAQTRSAPRPSPNPIAIKAGANSVVLRI